MYVLQELRLVFRDTVEAARVVRSKRGIGSKRGECQISILGELLLDGTSVVLGVLRVMT